MSGRRISMMVMPEDCLTFDIIAEAGQTFSWKPDGYNGIGAAAVVDIGFGVQEVANSEKIERIYEAPGLYKFKIYSCKCNYASWRGDVNIVSSNEKWEYLGANYKQLYSAFNGMTNALCNFYTLPAVENWASAFFKCTNARVPITEVPYGVKSLSSMFQDCKNISAVFTNFPDSVTNLNAVFASAKGTGKITLTKLPPNVTTLSTFAWSTNLVYADLDDLAVNAPEGGYQALTNIYYAFNNNPNITGSRSAFLAVCPNVTNTTNAFNNSNTWDGPTKVLYLKMGVDMQFVAEIDGGNLICTETGDTGRHEDLELDNPDVYFGEEAMWYSLGGRPITYKKVWHLGDVLSLGFTPTKIANVELLASSRDDVAIGEPGEMPDGEEINNWIDWDDTHLIVNDDDGSSAMYEIKITFE